MMKNAILMGLTGCLFFSSLPAIAETNQTNSNWHQTWFAGLGVGAGNVRVSSGTQRIYYNPYSFFDTYSTSSTKSTFPITSLEGGYRWSRADEKPFAYFLGVRYRYLTANNMSGNIAVLNNAAFPYGFNYETYVQTLSLFGKIDLMQMHGFAPYVTAGVGGAILRFGNYSEYPMTGVSIPRNSANFASNSSYNLTYDVGVGLDYYVTQNWLVALGYDYQNFGNLVTGNGAYNNLTGGTHSLNFGNATANTVFLQMDYLFNA